LCFLSAATGNILSQTTGEPLFYLLSYRASFEFVFDGIFGGQSLMEVFVQDSDRIPFWLPCTILVGWIVLAAALLRSTVCKLENR